MRVFAWLSQQGRQDSNLQPPVLVCTVSLRRGKKRVDKRWHVVRGGLRSPQIGTNGGTNSRLERRRCLNSDEWNGTRDREGWRVKGALVGHHIGGDLIGATMSEVEPGCKLWPYHTHYLNEEWVIVLRGEPTLRTPEGEQVLKEADVVCFSREGGCASDHQQNGLADTRTDALR